MYLFSFYHGGGMFIQELVQDLETHNLQSACDIMYYAINWLVLLLYIS